MKIVSCKNCGAKYQLENNEDISTYECSSCSGELELLESYSSPLDSQNSAGISSSDKYYNTDIVQCEDCNLKYKIKSDDNILDYECESCGGNLRYLNDELNEELDEFIKDRQPKEIYRKPIDIPQPENEEDIPTEESHNLFSSIKEFPNKFDTFFSEDRLEELVEEEENLTEFKKDESRTARTTIPESLLNKFGKEFDTPRSNDYYVLKDYLKNEFYSSMEKYYPDENESFNKFHIDDPEEFMKKINNLGMYDIITIVGVIVFIGGVIETFAINTGIGTVAIILGIILLCIGLIKSKDKEKKEARSQIIREHLLSLPEEYYVFYNVKVPNSSSGINHVVVGPTGIYGIISHKYNPKIKKLESENENNNLISSVESPQLEHYDKSGNPKFRYTTTKLKFEQDDKVKHQALNLGENLINFLNENDIKYCFVEPLVGFVNDQVVVINMPLTDEDLFIDELINTIKKGTVKLNQETIDKCAVLISKYSADCSAEY